MKKTLVPGWNDVCEKNFHKSLDYRSLAFKQHEKKQSNSKSYMTEIKALSLNEKLSLSLKKGGSAEGDFFCSYG